jgi:penicillin amidase
MSKKFSKFMLRFISGLAIVAILLSAFGVASVRRSFPQTGGEVRLQGLDGPVDIYRDPQGIPHIYAGSLHDLFLAQGYVHAQDRFWQMDFWRHIGSGRLSEMFGESQLETDAFLRTLGWRQIAEAEFASYDAESVAILTAYADGVNAYLAEHQGTALSLEYGILKLLTPEYSPEPWTPVNSLTWAKAMAWDLRGNMDEEIERAVLGKLLTAEQVAQLFPAYPDDHPVIVPGYAVPDASAGASTHSLPELDWSALQARLAGLDAVIGPSGAGIGSNSWAVAGSRTESGLPLLANDPHLGIQMPSIWYQVGLHCQPISSACPYEVAGFSFAGVPGVIIGHNEHIAWGFTNTGPDVMDLYIEKLNPENPNQYEFNGEWVDMTVRTEMIAVGGGEPVTLSVRSTRHGPVISDAFGDLEDFSARVDLEVPESYAIALRWTGLEPSTIFQAIWGFNKAAGWDEFRQAARQFNAPAQNLLYADTQGNIGYQMPGNIPLRAAGDGTLPVPGWTDAYEWTGYIPFEELPYAFNPPEGYIVTANNAVVGADYPHLITADWDYGFRADRIVSLIENAPGPVDSATIQQMQGDAYSANAALLVPLLLQVPLDDPQLASAREILAGWDYQERAESAPAALFEAFWSRLLTNTFADDLPEAYWPGNGSRWYEIVRQIADDPNDPWWDSQLTPDVVEDRETLMAGSFAQAVTDLQDLLGRDPAQWRWGELHSATFRNQTLGESGIGPIEALFNRGPFATGGGESLVNATGWTTGSFEVDWLPSMRMIVDLSDLDRSLSVHTTGQSGHAYAPHYADLAPLWAAVQYYPMRWNAEAIAAEAEAHLRLIP